jgi:hypothetical protein
MKQQITNEQDANGALQSAVVGSKVRITFKANAGRGLTQLASLCHKLSFDQEWLMLVTSCVVPSGKWEGIPRVQDFTITRMSGADRGVFAHILADIAESIEIL